MLCFKRGYSKTIRKGACLFCLKVHKLHNSFQSMVWPALVTDPTLGIELRLLVEDEQKVFVLQMIVRRLLIIFFPAESPVIKL